MLGKEHELGNHSIRQRERTLAHFVATAWHTIISGRAPRSQNDFATSRLRDTFNPWQCTILARPVAARILCPWCIFCVNGNRGNAVRLHCGTDRHIFLYFAIEIFSSRSHWCSKWESGSTSSIVLTERIPQRPWVQSRSFPWGISRFSRCGDKRRSGYASDSPVHLRSPSMQSGQDSRASVTIEEEL